MTTEDGVNAGARNVGRFFLMAVPLILALGATAWLGFYMGVHDVRKQLSQEERAAIAVGVTDGPLVGRYRIEIERPDCVTVTRADLDGSTLYLYATNTCRRAIRYLAWHIALVSPDGTILHTKYTNLCPVPRAPNAKAECVFSRATYLDVPLDDRAAVLRVWAMTSPS